MLNGTMPLNGCMQNSKRCDLVNVDAGSKPITQLDASLWQAYKYVTITVHCQQLSLSVQWNVHFITKRTL